MDDPVDFGFADLLSCHCLQKLPTLLNKDSPFLVMKDNAQGNKTPPLPQELQD